MRALPALLLLALAPAALASQPTPPWVFEGATVSGSGAVGDAVEAIVRVRVNSELDARLVLRTPEWVIVEGDAWDARGSAGEVIEREWRLTPTQEGFWAAIVQGEPPGFGAECACIMGFAGGAPESTVGTTPEGALPVPLLDRTLTVAPQEDGTARVERAVLPLASWLGHAELRVWITMGSTYLCESCAVAGPDPAHVASGPGREPIVAVATLPLREGDAYTLWDEVVARYRTADGATLAPTAVVQTGCENRRWGTDESWACDVASREWSHILGPGERLKQAVPATPFLATLALVLALALQRPPRGKRR